MYTYTNIYIYVYMHPHVYRYYRCVTPACLLTDIHVAIDMYTPASPLKDTHIYIL